MHKLTNVLRRRRNRNTQLISQFSNKKLYQEVSVPVPWGELRGRWWGRTDIRPILTLHGWQDNCGTFDRLIPLLNPDVGFLALDFPGHGYSSRLPLGIYYSFNSFIITIELIKRYFQWPKISFLGHSWGGMTSYAYTMIFPYKVDFLICIDGFRPVILNNNLATHLENYLTTETFAADTKEPPAYSTKELIDRIHLSNNGSIDRKNAYYIMERNTAASKEFVGKYYFTSDPRLKYMEREGFDQKKIISLTKGITCPIFVSKAKESYYFEDKENFYEVLDVLRKHNKNCEFHALEGNHHEHLTNPEIIADLINKFIQNYDLEDRKNGGFKETIIVSEEKDPRINSSYGAKLFNVFK